MDNPILLYYLGLLLFGLNGIMFVAVNRKFKEVKLAQETTRKTLLSVIKRRNRK